MDIDCIFIQVYNVPKIRMAVLSEVIEGREIIAYGGQRCEKASIIPSNAVHCAVRDRQLVFRHDS